MEVKNIMQEIKEYVKEQKETLKEKISKLDKKPYFVIVQIGNIEASNRYVRNKIKDCNEVGIETNLIKFEETVTQEELLEQIEALNKDNKVTAFMVQFPLPKHIDEKVIMKAISAKKDADGFNKESLVDPATPKGIVTYLERQGYDFRDKNALVIGRSEIVGKPAARLLLERNCNVTVIHSKTGHDKKLAFVENADLIICATGHINTLTEYDYYYSKDCVLFDVGINFTKDGKLIGDCEPGIADIAFQSPVPGGVGLLTRLQLLENILELEESK